MQHNPPDEGTQAGQSVTPATKTPMATADLPPASKRPRATAPDLSILNVGSREFLRDVEAVGRDREQLKTAVKELVSIAV